METRRGKIGEIWAYLDERSWSRACARRWGEGGKQQQSCSIRIARVVLHAQTYVAVKLQSVHRFEDAEESVFTISTPSMLENET